MFQGYAPLYDPFEQFFSRYVYRRVKHCFNRPICSVPGAEVVLKERCSDDHNWTFRYMLPTAEFFPQLRTLNRFLLQTLLLLKFPAKRNHYCCDTEHGIESVLSEKVLYICIWVRGVKDSVDLASTTDGYLEKNSSTSTFDKFLCIFFLKLVNKLSRSLIYVVLPHESIKSNHPNKSSRYLYNGDI